MTRTKSEIRIEAIEIVTMFFPFLQVKGEGMIQVR